MRNDTTSTDRKSGNSADLSAHGTNAGEPTLLFERLAADVELPHYATRDAAGMDIRAYLMGSKVKLASDSGALSERAPDAGASGPSLELSPGERAIIPTGFRVQLPAGYEAQVRPRSGTSFKKGLEITNSPGTIDADYRGEVGIIVKNATGFPLTLEHGERIAQMVIAPVARLAALEGKVDDTERGAGGFGSTGAK